MSQGRTASRTETACFEAGIKFGSLYHQFAGTPIDASSAATIAKAMEASIANQPYCRAVTVTMDTTAIDAAIEGSSASYVELSGRFFEAEIVIEYEDTEVFASMDMENGYPRMKVDSIVK